jgi:hypothetical protein
MRAAINGRPPVEDLAIVKYWHLPMCFRFAFQQISKNRFAIACVSDFSTLPSSPFVPRHYERL